MGSLLGICVIVSSAVTIQLGYLVLLFLVRQPCWPRGVCIAPEHLSYFDLYAGLKRLNGAFGDRNVSTSAVFLPPIALIFALSAMAYGSARAYLVWATAKDQLPRMLYGWTAPFAAFVDDNRELVVASVLATEQHQGLRIVYDGFVADLQLRTDRTVASVTLREADKYAVNMFDPEASPRWLETLNWLHIPGDRLVNIDLTRLPAQRLAELREQASAADVQLLLPLDDRNGPP